MPQSAGWEGRRDAREAGEAAPQGGAELGGLQQSSDSFDLAHGSHRLGSESAFTDSDSVLNSKQLAFVFTDIQDSTPISALAPASYKCVKPKPAPGLRFHLSLSLLRFDRPCLSSSRCAYTHRTLARAPLCADVMHIHGRTNVCTLPPASSLCDRACLFFVSASKGAMPT